MVDLPIVFGKRHRPTPTAYREAVAKVVRRLKAAHDLGNTDFAARIGCSDETVANAENERTSLDPIILLNIEFEFGAGSIDPVLELAGSHCVPEDEAAGGDALPPLSSAVHRIAAARSQNSPGGPEESRQELLDMEVDLLDARRGLNRMLARIRRLKGEG